MTQNLRSNSTVPSNWNLPAHQAEANQFVAASSTETIAMAVAAPAPAATGAGTTVATEVWKTTPYSGNFNPGTKHGNTIFVEKTKSLSEANWLDLTKKNSQTIHKYFRAQEMLMGDISSNRRGNNRCSRGMEDNSLLWRFQPWYKAW